MIRNTALTLLLGLCLVGCSKQEAEKPSEATSEESSSTEEADNAEASEPATRVNVTGNLVFSEGLWRDKTSWKPYTGGIYKLGTDKGIEGTRPDWSAAVREGKLHGKRIQYHDDGSKQSETPYIQGKMHGLSTSYRSYRGDGTKRFEENYEEGKRHGLYTWYHDDGTKGAEQNFKEGKRHGLSTSYREDGTKSSEENYEDGKRHGLHTDYNKDGTKEKECQYTHDMKGECKTF